MGQLVDLAVPPFTAAQPGRALAVPALAAARADQYLAADGAWKYMLGASLAVDLGRAYTGDGATTPETSLLLAGAALPSLFPASSAIGDAAEIDVRGWFKNNTGANQTVTLKVYHGAYTLVSVVSASLVSSATVRIFGLRLRVVTEVVGGTAAAKVRIIGERWGLDSILGVGAGWSSVPSNGMGVSDAASSGTDANLATNAARDFNVTATHSSNSANMTTTLNLARVLWYPKNY